MNRSSIYEENIHNQAKKFSSYSFDGYEARDAKIEVAFDERSQKRIKHKCPLYLFQKLRLSID
jgi:hypothetical protein